MGNAPDEDRVVEYTDLINFSFQGILEILGEKFTAEKIVEFAENKNSDIDVFDLAKHLVFLIYQTVIDVSRRTSDIRTSRKLLYLANHLQRWIDTIYQLIIDEPVEFSESEPFKEELEKLAREFIDSPPNTSI